MHTRDFLILVFSCILWTVDITSIIRDKDVIRIIILAGTHPCVTMNFHSQIPELQLLDSSSSLASSFRLPLSAGRQKCLIATRVCATVYGPSGMQWNHIFLPLFVLLQLPPLRRKRGRREIVIRIYVLDTFIYAALYACKPVRLTINHTCVYASFSSATYVPPRFKILLSLVEYSIIRRMQGRA